MKKITDLTEKYISQFVYGATDGTITTFAIVSGVMGANLPSTIILLLGVSNVLADGFSMASSNYLSARTEKENVVHPVKSAAATFVAFVVVGTIPLIPFIVGIFYTIAESRQFVYSIIATAIAFIVSGAIRGKVTGGNITKAALETLLIGGVAAYIAYIVGYVLKGIV